MAFAAAFRRILSGSSTPSPILHSQSALVHHNYTLTTPKLFVSGLSTSTTDENLFNAFGRSKGFGFDTYETVEDTEKTRERMNAKLLDGWVIFVDPARPREPLPRQPPKQDTKQSETGFTTNKTIGRCGSCSWTIFGTLAVYLLNYWKNVSHVI
ncbi:RNA-binding (RRM/RBD/RNP motif) family protein [Abeliophyllum distichum]|uniref:RNA-binding (RRM/RBD/RNP motif) family protein n=1 Tax=Abeliophyllum distichum TaxID=126358 RepID=A0ABD1T0W9_9LAMI